MKIKINVFLDSDNRINGYQSFPIDETMQVFDLQEIPQDLIQGEYGIQNGKIVKLGYSENHLKELELQKTEKLRNKREPLLEAYDRYKVNVLYGIEKIDTLKEQTDKKLIDDWYRKILDLNEEAINNLPEKIKYYL